MLFGSIEMHNAFKIALFVYREPLTITLLVEGYTDLKKNIVLFYSMHARNNVLHTRGNFMFVLIICIFLLKYHVYLRNYIISDKCLLYNHRPLLTQQS